jgi:hypothetical protein
MLRKLDSMIRHLKPGESLVFVDQENTDRRIIYHPGDSPYAKSVDSGGGH